MSKYDQGCAALLNYSQALLRVRTLAIAQGIATAAGSGYLTNQGLLLESIVVSCFGLALTGILLALHENYYRHFNCILQWVVDSEHSTGGGPWTAYQASRKLFTSKGRKLILHYGPFILVVFPFVVLISYNCMR